jgi:excisionase family DNA binding protein
MGPLLSIPEAAAALGIKRTMLYDLCAQGKITYRQVGRLKKFTESDIAEYIERCKVEIDVETGRGDMTHRARVLTGPLKWVKVR